MEEFVYSLETTMVLGKQQNLQLNTIAKALKTYDKDIVTKFEIEIEIEIIFSGK